MASAIGAVLISTILPPLADLAMKKVKAMVVDKVNGIVNIVSDISNLQTTLGMIQDIVQVAEKKQINYVFIRNWLRDLVDIAYEARDVLDDFITFSSCTVTAEEASKPVKFISSLTLSYFGGSSSDTSNIPLTVLNRLAKDIRSVKERFDEKIKESETFTKLKSVVGGGGSESVRVDRRSEVGPSINRDSLFLGREEVKEGIMVKIRNPRYDRVHVVAIWGMGGIGKTTLAQSIYNDERVKYVVASWLCVGESKFSAKKVISEMVVDQNTKAGIGNLHTKLVEKFKGNRFLIVLDDVWDVDGREWDLLFNPLTEVGNGGLIIITTRKREVCTATKTQETYDLKPLSEEDSLSLFESCAYLNGKADSTPDLKRTRKKIVQKLSGLPLALEVVGRSLLNKDYSTWTNFLESNDNEVMPELRRSYNHLPPHLKICFTYCALFPKDHVFDNEKVLVQMWMAHDLIQKDKQKRPEDVGAQYFEQLVNASLLQCVDGKYVMHDLIHDLTLLVSNGEFATANGSLPIDQMETVRHITITPGDYSKIPRLCKIEKLLSLYTTRNQIYTPEKFDYYVLEDVFKQLKSIRVLVLDSQEITGIPDCISELRHLRYLDVSKTGVRSLPDSLCRLYNLQTLELSNCLKLESLPPLGELTSLKRLSLRNVGVKRLGKEFYGKFTDSKVFFPSLELLSISFMEEWEEWDDIIIENSRVSFFPHLTRLEIKHCSKLVLVLPVVENPIMNAANFMTSLSRLEISECPQLQSLPADGLPPFLTYLKIEGCPLLYERCKDESGLDWHKINHIREREIRQHCLGMEDVLLQPGDEIN